MLVVVFVTYREKAINVEVPRIGEEIERGN
jgi:hypothetical protein